jgi:uncharacterized protein
MSERFSRYNIYGPLEDYQYGPLENHQAAGHESGNHQTEDRRSEGHGTRKSRPWFIANLLTGNADLLDHGEGERMFGHVSGTAKEDRLSGSGERWSGQENPDIDPGHLRQEFIEKGYLMDPAEERQLFEKKYREFLDRRCCEELQIFYVLRYACNFDCSYCYQIGYENQQVPPAEQVTDAFFRYIGETFKDRRKYVTLFGGEPLLPGRQQLRFMEHFLLRARESNMKLALVTNGYHLIDYLPMLHPAEFREIQVTLDGTRDMHDRRRPLKSSVSKKENCGLESGSPAAGGPGRSTFDRIVEGIDEALRAGHTVNLRVVLDRENMTVLPELAHFAAGRGWTRNSRFKTQLGRNYELHDCQPGREKLYTRAQFHREIYKLMQEHPEIEEFHRPAFSFAKFLFDSGSLPDPLFDACPACKSEWAFDYTGRIYPCTATVGKQDEELGTFFPDVRLDSEKAAEWQSRDVASIEACSECAFAPLCGGGCGSVAKNRAGTIHAPDCRPEAELAGMGLSHYFMNENSHTSTMHESSDTS